MKYSTGYTNKLGNIDEITDNPENYPSSILKNAINDAYTVYDYGNKSYQWYEQVCRICNEVLSMRGEKELSIKPK